MAWIQEVTSISMDKRKGSTKAHGQVAKGEESASWHKKKKKKREGE